MIIAGSILAVALLGLAGWLVFASGPSVSVPSLVGATRAAAERRATALGLDLVVKGTQLSPDVAKGSVASQTPSAGVVVSPGSSITVLISAGSESFALPDVVGQTLDAARAALRAKGLEVQFTTAASTQATGTVLGSLPGAGATVARGDVVRLTIAAAQGPATSSDLSHTSFVIDPVPPTSSNGRDVTFDVATQVADMLRMAGATVTLTRDTSGQVDVPDAAARLARSKETSATVFVGLSVSDTGIEGLQVLTMPVAGVSPAIVTASGPLGDAVFASLRADFASISTLTAPADSVLTGAGIAGVRIRLGSTLVKADRAAFANPAWTDRISRDIVRGVASLYGRSS